MCRYWSGMFGDIDSGVITRQGLVCVFFPFTDPRSGPNILCAVTVSFQFIGQFGNWLLSMYSTKSSMMDS